jgi:hypothetical protein
MINLPARCGLKTKRLVVELAEQFERRRGADRERRQADQEQCQRVGADHAGAAEPQRGPFHIGPQSCAGGREAVREALTGEHAGQPLTAAAERARRGRPRERAARPRRRGGHRALRRLHVPRSLRLLIRVQFNYENARGATAPLRRASARCREERSLPVPFRRGGASPDRRY